MNYFYFPFFVDEWMTGKAIKEMGYFEKGLYIDMLAYQWKEGKIPKDPKRIMTIFKLSDYQYREKISKVLKKFYTKNNYILNRKLEKLRKNYESGDIFKDRKSKIKSKNAKSKSLKNDTPKPKPKTRNKIGPIPKPFNTEASDAHNQGEGIGLFKNQTFINISKESGKAIREAIYANKEACNDKVSDDSPEVKKLLNKLLEVPELSGEETRTLAYILQSRRRKNKQSDLGSMVKILKAPKYAPSNEALKDAKEVLNTWQTIPLDSAQNLINDLTKKFNPNE